MIADQKITDTISALSKFKPKSIFLYGSRGRGDFMSDSDYEVGVIFDEGKYVQRSDIHAAISDSDVKAYPFKREELLNGTFKHVFQKSLYLREIIMGGRTIHGEHLIEHIPPLPITTLDLLMRNRFDIGMALAALLSYRSKDMVTSMEEFSKSCLYGVRSLIIMELKKFPIGYDEIYELSKAIDMVPEYRAVIDAARLVRKESKAPEIDIIYENISLLDTLIEPKMMAAFNDKGNQRII